MTRFLSVPQWQGSPSSRAMALIDGANAIVGDLPRSAVVEIDVPLEAGESFGTGVARESALQRVQERVGMHLLTEREPVITIGGDCSVTLPAFSHVRATRESVALVWFDAHPDLHTPASSPSGAFTGMALRAILGEGSEHLVDDEHHRASPHQVVLAGARAIDEAEATAIAQLGIRSLTAADLADTAALVEAVTASGAEHVYIHVDLDVLDPAEITGVSDAVPFGVTAAQLIAAIRAVREALPLAGATLAGFSPAHPGAAVEDMGTILRIIGALA